MEEGDLGSAARQTLEAVQRRVEVELIAAPLLVSAALSDSSHLSIKGMSGSPQLVSSSGSGTARAKWKSMITNASFRTKKLPDDITVAQVAEAEAAAAAAAAAAALTAPPSSGHHPSTPALGSITEEAGTPDEPSGGGGLKQFRLSELVKKKSKPKPAKSSGGGSNKTANNNGNVVVVQADSTADNNGSVLNNSSDGESGSKDDMELRRRSAELSNGSTAV